MWLQLFVFGLTVSCLSCQQSSTGILFATQSVTMIASQMDPSPSESVFNNDSTNTSTTRLESSSLFTSSNATLSSSPFTVSTYLHISNSTVSPNVTTQMASSTPVIFTSISHLASTITESIQPATVTKSAVVSSSQHISPTHPPSPVIVYKCGDECVTLRRRLYTSAVFAILFLVVSVILSTLLYRQYQISKDYQNDPSLSRLI